jgi:hypothetical protein
MKRSSKVTLTVVAAMGLAGCARRYDPCDSQYFNAVACSDAVQGGGYFWHGTWFPTRYQYAYPYYYDSYQRHVSGGGRVFGTPPGTYAHPAAVGGAAAGGVSAPSGGTVTRGGFGSTGSGHGAGE